MARLVKCRHCKKQNEIHDSYKVILYNSKGTPSNAYYCNEKHYEAEMEIKRKKEEEKIRKKEERDRLIEEERQRVQELNRKKEELKQLKEEEERQNIEKRKAEKDKAYYLICDIVGRKEVINTILWKEWAVWNKVADNKAIGQYLEENKDYLMNVISKIENTELSRIRYLSAILKNNLGDYKQKAKEFKPILNTQTNDMFYEITKTSTNKRRSLSDLEDIF